MDAVRGGFTRVDVATGTVARVGTVQADVIALAPRGARNRGLAVCLATAATIFVLVLGEGAAWGSRAPPLALPDAIAHADVVVVGTVSATRSRDRVAMVHVEERWKGEVGATLEVFGGPASDNEATSVDRTYAIGKRYLFIIYEPAAHGFLGTFGGRYEDTACSATRLYTPDLASLRPAGTVLNTSTSQPPAPSVETGEHAWTARTVVTLAALILVAVTLGAIAMRRRRHHDAGPPAH